MSYLQEGIDHAKAIAEHIASKGPDSLPKHVFSDPFLRCMRTADTVVGVLNEKFNNELKIKVVSPPRPHQKRIGMLQNWCTSDFFLNLKNFPEPGVGND